MKLEDNELVINELNGKNRVYYSDVIGEVNRFSVHVDSALDASKYYVDVSVPRKVIEMKTKYPELYSILISAFTQLFPNIKSIDVQSIDVSFSNINLENVPFIITDKVYRIVFVDENLNQPLDFMYLSSGAKRIFMQLVDVIVEMKNGASMIGIEEPENSIHPSLLKSYLYVMNSLVGDARIIFANHSPYIVQFIEPEGIYVGVPNNNGIARFNRIAKKNVQKIRNDASKEKYSVGEYIFDLLSGGKDDHEILEEYLEDELIYGR